MDKKKKTLIEAAVLLVFAIILVICLLKKTPATKAENPPYSTEADTINEANGNYTDETTDMILSDKEDDVFLEYSNVSESLYSNAEDNAKSGKTDVGSSSSEIISDLTEQYSIEENDLEIDLN